MYIKSPTVDWNGNPSDPKDLDNLTEDGLQVAGLLHKGNALYLTLDSRETVDYALLNGEEKVSYKVFRLVTGITHTQAIRKAVFHVSAAAQYKSA